VEVVLRILADRRAGAVDGLVRAPLPGLLARRLAVEAGHLAPVAQGRAREELVAAGVALVPHLGRLHERPGRARPHAGREGREETRREARRARHVRRRPAVQSRRADARSPRRGRGYGEGRRDREGRKSTARGGGGQGLVGRDTSTLAPNEGYALEDTTD